MRRPSTAALTRFAAICGLLVAPSAAAAQLRCADPNSPGQIRRVSFQGNATFGDDELALHVVSTPTDRTRRYIDKRIIPVGAVLGGALGAIPAQSGEKVKRGAIFAGVGAIFSAAVSRVSGERRCLRPGTLAGDILNLSGFYRDQGFVDVRVDTATTVDGRWVDVHFTVTEGVPVLVDSLTVIGFDTTAMGDLPKTLRSKKGERYSPTITAEDIDSLETRLRNSGFPEGQALREVSRTSNYRANVKFTIDPGPRARIGKVTVTRAALPGRTPSIEEKVVRDQLSFAPGDTYSERALFDSERRYYRIGSFLSAEIAPDLSHVRADSLVDVQVTVVEDLTHIASFEPGFGTLDCLRVRSEYTDKAFLGGVNRLDLSGSISKIGLANRWNGIFDACRLLQGKPTNEISSSAVNYNTTVRASRPVALPGGLLPSVSAYTERRGGFQAYLRTTRIGGALAVSKFVTRSVFFEGSYNLEYGHTDAAETVLCFLFQACDESSRDQLTQGDKRLAVLGARFSRDRRNNSDSASSGTVVRLDLRTSTRLFGSDNSLQFNKGVVDAAWYRRVIGSSVLAVRLRAGLVGGGQQTSGARLPPPQERLYAGGETSVRGFKQNELGPVIYVTSDSAGAAGAINAPDDSSRIARLQALQMRIIPAGGNEMYVGNLEYRIPGPFLQTLQTVLFVDVGALSTSGVTTVSGSRQFRITPGVAFKYFSPVGPIQINFGYNRYDPLAGPVYTDRIVDPANPGQGKLTCASGVIGTVCQPLPAIAPKTKFFNRITVTVAFPPDY